MAGRFSRTGRLKTQEQKEAQAYDFREGAKLPWVGVLILVVGMGILLTGGFFLMSQVNQPAMALWPAILGTAGSFVGLVLVLFPFVKWANL